MTAALITMILLRAAPIPLQYRESKIEWTVSEQVLPWVGRVPSNSFLLYTKGDKA